jgi:hypothetical protein
MYVGTDQRVSELTLNGTTGAFNTGTLFPSAPTGRFTGVTVGAVGTTASLFTGTATGNNALYGFQQSNLAQLFSTGLGSAVQGQPIQDGNVLLVNTADSKLHGLDLTGTPPLPDRVVKTLLTAGRTPLLANDGRLYVVRNGAAQAIADTAGFADVWNFVIAANATAAPTMDCSGMLYVAAGDTVYALITDMVGAANTGGLRPNVPWPKFQRDSRNTGNADFSTLWGVRTAGGSCTQ